MRVAISGGTGLIGKALAARLLERGSGVVIVSRSSRGPHELPSGAESAVWDCRSAAQLVPVLEGVEAFVHLAGESIGDGRWNDRRKRRLRESRVDSTAAVARAFAESNPRPELLMQGSAVGYYGVRSDQAIDETAAPGDDFLARLCRDWEDAGAAVEGLGVRRVIARTGVVFDARSGALPRILLPFKVFAGGPVGDGKQVLSWIHLADEVGAILHLLDSPGTEGAYNLVAPHAVTNRELARSAGKVLGRPAFLPTPGFALRLLLGEMSTLVLDGQRVLPSRLLESGYEFRFPEVEAALADLVA